MKNSKILLLEGVHPCAVELIQNEGFTNVELVQTALQGEELVSKLQGVSYVGIRSRTQITREVLEQCPDLKAIGCFCIGTNQVDLNAAREHGVPVFNAPFSNTRSVAELTMASAVFLMRGISAKNIAAHRGDWLKTAKDSYEVRGKKLGIIGYGNIGSQLSVLASGLGMHVYFYDIEKKLPHGNARTVNSMDELLEMSDVVTLHVPSTPETKNLMGEAAFEKMKEGSFLINHARGDIIDIEALVQNLKSGKVLGAAIDVFPKEPKSKEEEFVSALRGFDQVILTPHIGGSTLEAQQNIGHEVAEKIIAYDEKGLTKGAVNFPEVQMVAKGDQRITHTHKNIPGMLGKINDVLSHHNINIVGQQLQTKAETGYLVMDIEGTITEEIQKELSSIDGTIKVGVL